jgi:hypothetical protein
MMTHINHPHQTPSLILSSPGTDFGLVEDQFFQSYHRNFGLALQSTTLCAGQDSFEASSLRLVVGLAFPRPLLLAHVLSRHFGGVLPVRGKREQDSILFGRRRVA